MGGGNGRPARAALAGAPQKGVGRLSQSASMTGVAEVWKDQPVQLRRCCWMRPRMSGTQVAASSWASRGMKFILALSTPTSPTKMGWRAAARRTFFGPAAFPRVDMGGVNDAVALGGVLQRVAVDNAGEVEGPVEGAGDDDVAAAEGAHVFHGGLRARGLEAVGFPFLLLGEEGGFVGRGFGFFGHEAAVAPDFPRDAVRLVDEVKEDGGMVGVESADIGPKGEVLVFDRAVNVEVDNEVGAAVGGGVDEGGVDEGAVGNAAIGLAGGFAAGLALAAPVGVFHGEADDDGIPVLDGLDGGGDSAVAFGVDFEAGDGDALEPDFVARGVN